MNPGIELALINRMALSPTQMKLHSILWRRVKQQNYYLDDDQVQINLYSIFSTWCPDTGGILQDSTCLLYCTVSSNPTTETTLTALYTSSCTFLNFTNKTHYILHCMKTLTALFCYYNILLKSVMVI